MTIEVWQLLFTAFGIVVAIAAIVVPVSFKLHTMNREANAKHFGELDTCIHDQGRQTREQFESLKDQVTSIQITQASNYASKADLRTTSDDLKELIGLGTRLASIDRKLDQIAANSRAE